MERDDLSRVVHKSCERGITVCSRVTWYSLARVQHWQGSSESWMPSWEGLPVLL